MDFFLHQSRERRVAHLSRIVENAVGRARRRRIEIGRVGEDDVGRLAAAFEADRLHVGFAGVFQEQLSDLGRAGEGDRIHIHVPAERLAGGLAEARDDVEDARRDARFGRQLGHAQRRQRRLLGRLQHHELPAARAGANFHAAISSGKFHGMTAPTTPSGSRVIRASAVFAVGAISS